MGFFSNRSTDRDLIDHVTADKVEGLFSTFSPDGGTYLAPTLQAAIDLFIPKSSGILGFGAKKQNPARPVFIAVFTDGAAGDADAIVNVIVDATKRITDRAHLGILFVQVGDDPQATRFLDKLNNDLGKSGAEHDIVAVVRLEDLEDDTPDQTIFRAFSE
jgi:hypothetical protein